MRTGWRLAITGALALGIAQPALAQRLIPGDRPGDDRLEAEPLPPEDGDSLGPILPPFPIPPESAPEGWLGPVRIAVREIIVSGNESISDEALRAVTRPYEGQALDFSELLELRDRLTLVYVDAGFVSSGAVLRPQTIREGTVRFEIIEGRLSDVSVNTSGRYRAGSLRRRLRLDPERTLNVFEIERRLRVLQQDRRIERIEARLEPTTERGLSALNLDVMEAPPLSVAADFDNYRSPAIGAEGGRLRARYDNLAGIGDWLEVEGSFSEGLNQLEGVLAVPVSPWDTLLSIGIQWSDADIVSEPISSTLDIETTSRTLHAELRQPLWQTANVTLETYLRGELRRSKSYLDDSGTPFADGVEDDGVSKVSVLRWGLEWVLRTREQALALRSIASLGLDAFDATHNSGGIADGQFLAWLAQLQWARRLPAVIDSELVVRADLQVANSPLLPLEQFAVGGRYSVRGYRENTLVRDNGFLASLELRVPIYQRIEPRLRWELAPFVDLGQSWSTNRQTVGQQTLMSAGIGTRITVTRFGSAELFWGHRILDTTRIGESDLQDDGIHLRISAHWP